MWLFIFSPQVHEYQALTAIYKDAADSVAEYMRDLYENPQPRLLVAHTQALRLARLAAERAAGTLEFLPPL